MAGRKVAMSPYELEAHVAFALSFRSVIGLLKSNLEIVGSTVVLIYFLKWAKIIL
jgi:hypothetical protein